MSKTRTTQEHVQKHPELTPIHDFASKLAQPGLLDRLKEYVRWQAELRRAEREGRTLDGLLQVPDRAPISINLDLTTSCNFACDHCIDMDILNTGIHYNHEKLMDSLRELARRGMRSVILIGGGEPTIYPKFTEIVHLLKDLGIQVSIVSNGAGNRKILEVAHRLEPGDWVRLSLDSGSEDTFQKMHKPRKPITLDEICEGVPPIKDKNPNFEIGFSFIVTWRDATINDEKIVPNIHEMVQGAERARKYRFDYIAYKPFLVRAPENNAEIVGLDRAREDFAVITRRIRAEVDKAKELETENFRVVETTNLKVLENGTFQNYMEQPKTCHMQFFRQVVSPLGLYNCPVYRNQPHGMLGPKHGYAENESTGKVRRKIQEHLQNFDASKECREVTCLYNHVNWWIEDLIENPEKLDELQPGAERNDTFL